MLRRVVRKAVQEARNSLPGVESRGSPLVTVLPRIGVNTALGNAAGDECRWHEKDRNASSTLMILLNKHGADVNAARCLHSRAALHIAGSPSTVPVVYLRAMSSLVDASKSNAVKSETSKGIKVDMTVKEEPEKAVADARILRSLASYLWPKDNSEFRRRVALALSLLVASKVLNVQVPFLFKYAVDTLSTAAGATGATAAASAATTSLLFATPAAVLLGYGIARTGASACNGLDVCFARVV